MFRFIISVFCFFLIIIESYAETSVCDNHHCIAVVDAGSSGSRLHIFVYDLDQTNTPNDIKEIWSKRMSPGFATIENNQNTVDTYLNNLFAEAPIQKLSVYFYATAGMRLLPQMKQKEYYQAIQNWFNQQTEWQLIEAKTITGTDEALYGWLAVNYYLDTFKSTPVGIIDIGGASVQIAFPIQNISELNKKSQITFDLYGQHINLFAQSFLGLGQKETSHQFRDSISCFAQGYLLPNGEIGQGDAAQCEQDTSFLINQVHQVKKEVQPILDINHITTWYALGGLAALAEMKPFYFQNNQVTSQDLLQQTNNLFCHQPWEILIAQYPNDEYIELSCFLPAFYSALMVDGYGFGKNQPVNIIPSASFLDWTTGVVLHH